MDVVLAVVVAVVVTTAVSRFCFVVVRTLGEPTSGKYCKRCFRRPGSVGTKGWIVVTDVDGEPPVDYYLCPKHRNLVHRGAVVYRESL